jgi:hypothetical protein
VSAPRWLLALVVATGLLAMHGITASTANAAAPCGAALPHEHTVVATGDPLADGLLTVQQVSDVQPLSGHAGALCLAILVGGLVVGLLVRRTPRGRHAAARGSTAPIVALAGRAPPDTALALLCVSRT